MKDMMAKNARVVATPKMIPIARTWMDEKEADAARRAILSGWITQGPEVTAFEKEFASAVGSAHACAVSNCTTALHLAMTVVGVRPGDDVVTVSHSFIATANSIRHCGARPVFVDVEPATFNLDPARLEAAITPRTKAVLCAHQLGMPCDLAAILAVARKRGLPVIEDAACAIGSEIRWNGNWEKIGRPHADVACFSFHPRKLVTTGDGGMLTTANAEWDRKFRLSRQHGMNVPDTVRHSAREVIFESYPEPGFNYRLTDIQAAVGREQLKRLPEMITRRRFLAQRYSEQLRDETGLQLPCEPEWARSNWQSYCVLLPEGCDQRRVMQLMLDAGIATRRGVMCAHREGAYPAGTWSCGSAINECQCAPGQCERLKCGEAVQDHGLILPLYQQMTEAEQDFVVTTLKEACHRGSTI